MFSLILDILEDFLAGRDELDMRLSPLDQAPGLTLWPDQLAPTDTVSSDDAGSRGEGSRPLAS